MKKLTKRKAFNFLRSYFDVLNEIPNDKDKLSFLLAVINKQFLDEEPKDLNFIVNLCYESQRHQIEESVKGWERATNQTLKDTPQTPSVTPCQTPSVTPSQEEEEKEEEKEKTKAPSGDIDFNYEKFLHFINITLGRKLRVITDTDKKKIRARLKEGYTKDNFQWAVENVKEVQHHIESNFRYCDVEFFTRQKTLNLYGQEKKTFVRRPYDVNHD